MRDYPFSSFELKQDKKADLWLSEKFTAVFVTHDIDEAIRLGTKIVLLAGEPANITDIFEINEEYPRERNHPHFKEIRVKILERFKNAYLAKRSLL